MDEILRDAKTYEPQKDVTLTTPENDKLQYKEVTSPEAAIMTNLYTPGTHTAAQLSEKDNEFFVGICRQNAEKIIAGLKDKFGAEKAVTRYLSGVGEEIGSFVFEMQDYKHLKK